jgi:hypothetical protein
MNKASMSRRLMTISAGNRKQTVLLPTKNKCMGKDNDGPEQLHVPIR